MHADRASPLVASSCARAPSVPIRRCDADRSTADNGAAATVAGAASLRPLPCPTPRRARKSRAEQQAHPGARRTFHESRGRPQTAAESAWQGKKSGVAPLLYRSAKASQSAASLESAAFSPCNMPTSAQALRSSAHAARARAYKPTAHQSSAAVRPAPRTAAPSPRSRAKAQKPRRRAPHLREPPSACGERTRDIVYLSYLYI